MTEFDCPCPECRLDRMEEARPEEQRRREEYLRWRSTAELVIAGVAIGGILAFLYAVWFGVR